MTPPLRSYHDTLPLLPTTAPCPTCGVLVRVRIWHGDARPQRWEALAVPQTLLLGLPHHCAELRTELRGIAQETRDADPPQQ